MITSCHGSMLLQNYAAYAAVWILIVSQGALLLTKVSRYELGISAVSCRVSLQYDVSKFKAGTSTDVPAGFTATADVIPDRSRLTPPAVAPQVTIGWTRSSLNQSEQGMNLCEPIGSEHSSPVGKVTSSLAEQLASPGP